MEKVMIAVDKATRERLKVIAGDIPMITFLRQLSKGDNPQVTLNERLDRIERKLDTATRPLPVPSDKPSPVKGGWDIPLTQEEQELKARMAGDIFSDPFLTDKDKENIRRESTLTGEHETMIKALYEEYGVNNLNELVDAWNPEGMTEQEKLLVKYLKGLYKYVFEVAEGINNPVKPKGEG